VGRVEARQVRRVNPFTVAMLAYSVRAWLPEANTAVRYAHWAALVACPLLGGLAVAALTLVKLRRKHEGGEAESPIAVTVPLAAQNLTIDL
jgi:hypothetical protein